MPRLLTLFSLLFSLFSLPRPFPPLPSPTTPLYPLQSHNTHSIVPLRHSRVKVNDEDSVHLGAWLATQRREHLNGKMKPERLAFMQTLVDEGKLEWAPMNHSKQSEQTWPLMFDCLRLYCEEHQAENPGTEVSSIPENRKWIHPDGHEVGLGRWMHTQNKQRRAGKLRPDRCAKMQELVDAGMFRWPTQRQFKSGGGGKDSGDGYSDDAYSMDGDTVVATTGTTKRGAAAVAVAAATAAAAAGVDIYDEPRPIKKRARLAQLQQQHHHNSSSNPLEQLHQQQHEVYGNADSTLGGGDYRHFIEPGDKVLAPTNRKSIAGALADYDPLTGELILDYDPAVLLHNLSASSDPNDDHHLLAPNSKTFGGHSRSRRRSSTSQSAAFDALTSLAHPSDSRTLTNMYGSGSDAAGRVDNLTRMTDIRTSQMLGQGSAQDSLMRDMGMHRLGVEQEPQLLRNHSLDLEPGSEGIGFGTSSSSRRAPPLLPMDVLAMDDLRRRHRTSNGSDGVTDGESSCASDGLNGALGVGVGGDPSLASANVEPLLTPETRMQLKAQVEAQMHSHDTSGKRPFSLDMLATTGHAMHEHISRNNTSDSNDGLGVVIDLASTSRDMLFAQQSIDLSSTSRDLVFAQQPLDLASTSRDLLFAQQSLALSSASRDVLFRNPAFPPGRSNSPELS